MKTIKLLAAAALSAAAVVAILAVSASGQPSAARAASVQQYVAGSPSSKYLDLAAPKGPSTGDQFVDSAMLLDPRTNRPVGKFAQVCTAAAVTGKLFGTCQGVLKLPHGDLIVAVDDNNDDVTTEAITGGTGSYSRASGTIVTAPRGNTITVTVRAH